MRAPESDGRVARRSRLAGAGLAIILLAVSLFAVWSSQATGAAASKAVTATTLSEDYADARSAVTDEESLERKYRLEPGPAVRTRHDQAAAAFVVALGHVRRDGRAADRALVDRLLVQHRSYLGAVHRMFRAVDRGDTPLVLVIDHQQADPPFGAIQASVGAAADVKHASTLAQLSYLTRLENLTRRITPLVFLLGLIIAVSLASVTRGHRRLLSLERAQAVHDSLHDALSGLPNRTLLTERLFHALHRDGRPGTSTGLLLIDLDRFKEINDTFGHHYGDELLRQIGPRLRAALREVDTVARLGGDEFAVLLPDIASVDDAMAVATLLRRALETPFAVCGVDLDVEASIGVVTSGQNGHEPGILLQRADIAMYVAKKQNLGAFAYAPDIDGHSPAKLALLGELRRALESDELVLHYQPKVDIATGEVIGAEALLRWQHPGRGMVFPDGFIPLAEHTGLIGPLTRHVLASALAQMRRWADLGRPLTVSVNLSARNLLDERLPQVVEDLLTAHGVPADLLQLEVTESALMLEPERARQILERLSLLGVRISIDDFGAGYTSLSQLTTLPVNELKIDKSFVMTMTEDPGNTLIVRSVIELGHRLGLSIVAEGVETELTLRALDDVGCDIAQGFYLSRAVPADAFEAWLGGRPGTLTHPLTMIRPLVPNLR